MTDILAFRSPKQWCPPWGVLAVGAKGPGVDQGAPSNLRPFCFKFSHKSALASCPCAFRLRRLAQNGYRGLPRAHSSWQAQNFVDLNSKVAETRNLLVTLCVSNRSRFGAVRIFISLARPSRHFVRVGMLLFWRSANLEIARTTLLALCACQIALAVARCELGDR